MSSHKHIISLCLIAVLLLPSIAAATARYVATSGADTNPGTFAQPYLTITKAVSSSSAGDTIWMRGGTYALSATISISKNGTSASRYHLYAYPGERPLLNYSSMAVSSSNRGINLSGSYWHIKGVDIYKAGDNGMNISGSNNIIEWCSFFENSDSGLQLGGGAANNQILNCDSYFNADPGNGNADGFSPKLDVGTGNYFYGCRSWQNSDDGWDGYMRPSDNITTTIENCWCFKNGYLKSGSASTGNGNGFKMGGGDLSNADSLRHNMTLIRCLSFDNRVKGYDQNNNRGSMTLLNCTAYRNGTNYQISAGLKTGSVLTVKNCVSAGTGGVSLLASAVTATNSWQSPFVVTNADFMSIDTAGVRGPRKSDGSLPDIAFMHPAPGSDLIDAGTDIGLSFKGSAPDLGAFETDPMLPVELISFNAETNGTTIALHWTTASEVSNAGFEIYRSSIGPGRSAACDRIGFVPGAGTANSPHEYYFTDAARAPGRYRYRILQIDAGGRQSNVREIEITVGTSATAFMLEPNYPNPFNPATTIRFSVTATGPASLKVYSGIGQEAAALFDGIAEAGTAYSLIFNGSRLASGAYFCVLVSGQERQMQKMILSK